MKKLFPFMLAVIAMMAVSCERPEEPGPNEETFSVVGTWIQQMDDLAEVLTLQADNSFSLLMGSLYKEEGTYTCGNDTLTLAPTQAWERDYVRDPRHGGPVVDDNGNYQYTEWQPTNSQEGVRACKIKMIYSGDVLMQERTSYFDDPPHVLWAPYVKEDATHVSNINDVQGKWCWLFHESEAGIPRVIVKVNGNNGEVIITPWGERYVGSVRYEKGVLYMDNPTFYTSRYQEDGSDEWEHMNYEDPESTPWHIPNPNDPYASWGSYGQLVISFVVDGNVAYGGIANLLADFEKQ